MGGGGRQSGTSDQRREQGHGSGDPSTTAHRPNETTSSHRPAEGERRSSLSLLPSVRSVHLSPLQRSILSPLKNTRWDIYRQLRWTSLPRQKRCRVADLQATAKRTIFLKNLVFNTLMSQSHVCNVTPVHAFINQVCKGTSGLTGE